MIPSEIKGQSEINAQQQFKTLLLEISKLFINLPAEQIDSQIENAQARICEILDINRSTLWQVTERTRESLELTHIYQTQRYQFPAIPTDVRECFPWTLPKVLAGEILAISKMSDLPAEAALDLENWRLYGTKSSVLIPLSIGKRSVFGVLTFAVLDQERIWTDEIIEEFQLIAQIFANALARKQTEKILREIEKCLILATDATGAGLWSIKIETGKMRATSKTRELFHLNADEELEYEKFFKMIHPDDRERVHHVLHQARRPGDQFLVEYRLVPSGGSPRWIMFRGKRFSGLSGDPDCLMGVSLDITECKNMEDRLQERLVEIDRLKKQLEKENIYLCEEIQLQGLHEEIVFRSPAMKQVLVKVEQVAGLESTVLLQGETGVGKELLARAIHRLSPRKNRQMVTVNCAALPPTLMESELFGREKGAYTGAMTKMTGRFEIADGSTLFLDEIGELPHEIQAKLLRFLEEGRFERLGSTKTLQVKVRVIAATNRNLEEEVAKGNFRKDLYYRLNVFPVVVPPLRERQEDIPPLIWSFVREFEKKIGKRIDHIPRKNMENLKHYPWPGNVRELKNLVEYAMITARDKTLEIRLPQIKSLEKPENYTLEDLERRYILDILRKTGWRLTGTNGAAQILGLKRTTLHSKMKKLGIYRPSK